MSGINPSKYPNDNAGEDDYENDNFDASANQLPDLLADKSRVKYGGGLEESGTIVDNYE